MRKKIIAANWKMHLTLSEAISLTNSILTKLESTKLNGTIVLIPASLYLSEINKNIKNHHQFALGAQNFYPGIFGAFTGEISATMLSNLEVEYVLIGHSERRTIFQEKNAFLAEKINNALQEDLIPIFCCGENKNSREKGDFLETIKIQLEEGLFQISCNEISKIVIAYEPIWAIGTGLIPTSEEIMEVHEYIRGILASKYGTEIAENISILYGGSCNAQNASSLYNLPDVDGLLVGGASLKADSFLEILKKTIAL